MNAELIKHISTLSENYIAYNPIIPKVMKFSFSQHKYV